MMMLGRDYIPTPLRWQRLDRIARCLAMELPFHHHDIAMLLAHIPRPSRHRAMPLLRGAARLGLSLWCVIDELAAARRPHSIVLLHPNLRLRVGVAIG